MAASFSQSVGTFVIPTAERTDPEPVRASLAQALAEFERGAVREALRHLRRAAESADEAGNELRSVALARAAADLATEVGTIATPPPPPPALAPPVLASTSAAPPSIARISPDSALKQLLESGRAVKVVVRRSTRDDELYVVRRADGNAPTLGAREAVMVLLEADDGFFEPPKA
jgi:hypothetical protein